jgi:predicted amidohydrolase YtcJ
MFAQPADPAHAGRVDADGVGSAGEGSGLVILGGRLGAHPAVDIRVAGGTITEITSAGGLRPTVGEVVIEAHGGAVIAGLRDHHVHLRALGAARHSLPVGPPEVRDRAGLAEALRQAAAAAGPGAWIRGIGYHESVAGPLDRAGLDAMVADHPVRIQHRSGQLWMLNSAGMASVGAEQPDGRLLHADRWLRHRLGPDVGPEEGADLVAVGGLLASFGVTGVTDATVSNGPDDALALPRGLAQQVLVMGDDRLAHGPRKVVLHDDDLPALDELSAVIRTAHHRGRVVAIHCVTGPSLWLALTAFAEAGSADGDRIEHGSVIPPEAVPPLLRLGLTVVTQPNFVSERGEAYLDDVDAGDQPWLYRLAGLLDAGIAVAAGTDSPFGNPDPWRAMVAAIERRTDGGRLLGAGERVSPEQALALFSGDLERPSQPLAVAAGARADLCVLALPWKEARHQLSRQLVVATIRAGHLIHSSRDRPVS